MADLLDGIARHLADKGIVTFETAAAPGGDCFIDNMPSEPDEAVALSTYDDAREPDSLLGYDEPRVQVRVRGTRDPRVGQFMKDKVFSPGRMKPWSDLTRYATGEQLNAKAFAAEFNR